MQSQTKRSSTITTFNSTNTVSISRSSTESYSYNDFMFSYISYTTYNSIGGTSSSSSTYARTNGPRESQSFTIWAKEVKNLPKLYLLSATHSVISSYLRNYNSQTSSRSYTRKMRDTDNVYKTCTFTVYYTSISNIYSVTSTLSFKHSHSTFTARSTSNENYYVNTTVYNINL